MIIIDPKIDEETYEIIYKSCEVSRQVYKLEDDVEVLVTFNGEACEGYEAVTIPSEEGKFLVALNPEIEWKESEIVKTIGHELCHVKQFSYNGLELNWGDVVTFRGQEYRFENDMEYWLSPWEIEARGYEAAIWVLYVGEDV